MRPRALCPQMMPGIVAKKPRKSPALEQINEARASPQRRERVAGAMGGGAGAAGAYVRGGRAAGVARGTPIAWWQFGQTIEAPP